MNELFPLFRGGSQPQALHFAYEKAGLTIRDQPIPWNAEAVILEATVQIPRTGAGRPQDYYIRLAGQPSRRADAWRPDESGRRHIISFQIAPPRTTCTAELCLGERALCQLTLPCLSEEEFRAGLRLQMPTTFVRVLEETVACQTFVSSQCKGLHATAVLTSPTSLIPLIDLPLQVEFRQERALTTEMVRVWLTSGQLAGKTALVSVAPRKTPRRIGPLAAHWLLGERLLASQRVRAISVSSFHRSLCVIDVRFLVRNRHGELTTARQLPPLDEVAGVGPCFVVASREPGMAGHCLVGVDALSDRPRREPAMFAASMLLTDGPNVVAPGLIGPDEVRRYQGFQLSLAGQPVAVLPTVPAPKAAFDAEGGFKPPADYLWSPAAEDELNERLSKLFE